MSNEKPELLKFPFCGKDPRYVPADYVDNHGQPWPFAECNPCNVGAPVEFWNRRAGGAALPARKSVESGPHYSVNSASEYGYLAGWNACLDEAFTEQPAPVAVVMPELETAFEAWWESDGQYCRAGGGSYEKTFAYRGYEAALAEVARLNSEPKP